MSTILALQTEVILVAIDNLFETYYSRHFLAIFSAMFVGNICAQPVIDCAAEVEIPIDSVSCQGTLTDLSYLVTNNDGSFTIAQNPTAGSAVDAGFNHQMRIGYSVDILGKRSYTVLGNSHELVFRYDFFDNSRKVFTFRL